MIFDAYFWLALHPVEALIILPFYFIPVFVAKNRNHKQKKAITVLTIFGGWTYIGWVVAFTWAEME